MDDNEPKKKNETKLTYFYLDASTIVTKDKIAVMQRMLKQVWNGAL